MRRQPLYGQIGMHFTRKWEEVSQIARRRCASAVSAVANDTEHRLAHNRPADISQRVHRWGQRDERGAARGRTPKPGTMSSALRRLGVVAHPSRDRLEGRAGREDRLDPSILERGDVVLGNDAAAKNRHVISALLAQFGHHRRK